MCFLDEAVRSVIEFAKADHDPNRKRSVPGLSLAFLHLEPQLDANCALVRDATS